MRLRVAAAGKTRGKCIADHQPPNKMINMAKAARGLRGFLLRHWPNAMTQRFYPHCERCSGLQVRSGGSLLCPCAAAGAQVQVLMQGKSL